MTSEVVSRVRLTAEKLSATERRMVDALLDHKQGLALLSGPQLSARLDVHGAAPTRLAQKLGYRGYPELRGILQRELLKTQDAAVRMRRSLEAVAEGNFLVDLIAAEISALQGLADSVPQAEINRAADVIFGAKKVFIFAQGHAQSVAHFLIRRLNRFGMTTVALEGHGRDIAERLVCMGPEDAVVALAFRRQPSAFSPMMAHALRAGASSILISDLAGLTMTPRAGILLAAPRGRSHNEFQTPTVPFAIVSAILLTIAARHEAETLGALERLSDLFPEFEDQ